MSSKQRIKCSFSDFNPGGLLDIFDELGFIRKNYNRYKLIPVMEYFFGEVFATLKLEREALQSVDLSPVIDEMVELISEYIPE